MLRVFFYTGGFRVLKSLMSIKILFFSSIISIHSSKNLIKKLQQRFS